MFCWSRGGVTAQAASNTAATNVAQVTRNL
jgi:hypothetical protein